MRDWFKQFFVPTENNDFKPNALERAAFVGMVVLVMISFSIANLQSVLWISSEWLVSTILPAVVTDATNAARADEGRAPLVRDSLLDQAAQLKAEDMAARGYFAHWSPDGVSPWHWFEVAGYSYKHAGENLAVHFTDSDAVVDAWLKSPTHRENIMDEKFTEIGIGTAKGRYQDYDTVFVVQMFGSPAAAATEPAQEPVEIEEPASVTEIEESVAAPEVAGATETDSPVIVAEVSPEESEASIDVTESGTVVYESFATVTDPEATLSQSKSAQPSTFWGRLATSPKLVLQILYSIIGSLVVLALVLSIVLEWRRQHPVQLAYGFAMLAFMIILLQVHVFVASRVIIG